MRSLWTFQGSGSVWDGSRRAEVACCICGQTTKTPGRFKNEDTQEYAYVCGGYSCQKKYEARHSGEHAHVVLYVAFTEGKNGSITRVEGRVSFHKEGPRPKAGEIWQVEVVGENRKQTVYFLRTLNRLYGVGEWETFGSPAKPKAVAVAIGSGSTGPWDGNTGYTVWALPRGWRSDGR